MQDSASRYIPLKRQGSRLEIIFTTFFWLSIKITSMVKRIKKVCMELQDVIMRAWPLLSSLLPNSPFILLKGLSATIVSSANTVFLVLLSICI